MMSGMDTVQLFVMNLIASAVAAVSTVVWISNRRFINQDRDRAVLNQLPRHEPAPLIEVLTREARRYQFRRRIIEPIETICRIAIMISPLLFWLGKGLVESTRASSIVVGVLPWLFFLVGGFGFGVVGRLFGPSTLHRMATERLLEMAGPYVLAALIDMLAVEDTAMRSVAEETLTLRLPHLKSHDGDHLTVQHMDTLYRCLKERAIRNQPLALAILKALEQIGDETTIPILGELLALEGDDLKPVQAAALECLAFVQNRMDSQAGARSLMRASTAPGDPRDQLLRPVAGPSKSDETLLVRPSDEPD